MPLPPEPSRCPRPDALLSTGGAPLNISRRRVPRPASDPGADLRDRRLCSSTSAGRRIHRPGAGPGARRRRSQPHEWITARRDIPPRGPARPRRSRRLCGGNPLRRPGHPGGPSRPLRRRPGHPARGSPSRGRVRRRLLQRGAGGGPRRPRLLQRHHLHPCLRRPAPGRPHHALRPGDRPHRGLPLAERHVQRPEVRRPGGGWWPARAPTTAAAG